MTSLVSFFSSGSEKYRTSRGRNTCTPESTSYVYVQYRCHNGGRVKVLHNELQDGGSYRLV